jgi:cytochrome c556
VRGVNKVLIGTFVVWAGAVVMAQAPMTGPELDKLMKDIGPAMQATGKAVKSAAFADAVPQLAIVKRNLTASRRFWVEHKKDDAIKANDDAVAAIEAAERLFASSSPAPTPASGLEAMRRVETACRSCHETYRERDADNNWVLKPGSIN